MVCLFWQASWKFIKNAGGDPDPTHYTYMAPELRDKEFRALCDEVDRTKGTVTPNQYFSVLKRFMALEDAEKRARLEEGKTQLQAAYHGVITAPLDRSPDVNFWENQYIAKAQQSLAGDWKAIDAAKTRAGIDAFSYNHALPPDPMLGWSWLLFYLVGMFLAFGHFMIRLDQMGGAWWLSTSDVRLYFWLAAWPAGVFRYPMAVDVKQQLVRARRFAAFVLSSALPLFASACAGKQVKTEPTSKRKSAPYALRVDASTSTLNTYMGANGGIFHPAPVQQSVMTASLPRGFYIGAWHSAPIGQRDLVPNFAREIDALAGWGGKTGPFAINIDSAFVAVTPLAQYSGDVMQTVERIGHEFDIRHSQTLTPYLSFTQAWPTTNNTPRRGFFYREGLQWGWKNKLWSGGASAELTHDSGAFGFESGFLAQGKTSISRRFGAHLRAEIPLRWCTPISKLNDGRKFSFETGLTLAISK